MVCDPSGPKIGNGGATMHVLEQLEDVIETCMLCSLINILCLLDAETAAKVLLIHAGGYSQRIPIASVVGKVFLTLPHGMLFIYCQCNTVACK